MWCGKKRVFLGCPCYVPDSQPNFESLPEFAFENAQPAIRSVPQVRQDQSIFPLERTFLQAGIMLSLGDISCVWLKCGESLKTQHTDGQTIYWVRLF